jgi:hypothetical protein
VQVVARDDSKNFLCPDTYVRSFRLLYARHDMTGQRSLWI